MLSKGNKHLQKKQFDQILKLQFEGPFEVPMFEQVLEMFNEMGYQPQIPIASSFKKSKLPSMWSFFFSAKLRCLTRRNYGIDKAKLQFNYVMAGLYYCMKVDFASLLWDEFTTCIKNSKKTNEIANAHIFSLILHEA